MPIIGNVLGTVQAHATTGQFAITATRALVNGESIFTTATDAAGNISAATSLQVVITQPPLVSGLRGSFYGYHQPANGNVELTNVAQVLGLIANKTPDATFTATRLQYAAPKALGMDANLQTFLNTDAASLSRDPGSTSDAIIRFDGRIQLSAGSYNFRVRADDGYSIRVNGAVVAEHNANQSPTTRTHGAFTINQSGLHDIEIIYWDAGVGNALAVELANTATGTYSYLNDSILFQAVAPQPLALSSAMRVLEDDGDLFYFDKNAALIQAMASFAPENGIDTRYRAAHVEQNSIALAVGY